MNELKKSMIHIKSKQFPHFEALTVNRGRARRNSPCIFAAVLLCPLSPLPALSSSLWHPLHSPAERTDTTVTALRVNKTHASTRAAQIHRICCHHCIHAGTCELNGVALFRLFFQKQKTFSHPFTSFINVLLIFIKMGEGRNI